MILPDATFELQNYKKDSTRPHTLTEIFRLTLFLRFRAAVKRGCSVPESRLEGPGKESNSG